MKKLYGLLLPLYLRVSVVQILSCFRALSRERRIQLWHSLMLQTERDENVP